MSPHTATIGPVEAQYRAEAIARRKRLMTAPAAKPEPVTATVVRIAPPKPATVHVIDYQAMLDAETDPADYIRIRAASVGSSEREIRGISRKRPTAHLRAAIAYEVRIKFNLCYPTIAALMARDHTSLISGVRAHCFRHGLPYPVMVKDEIRESVLPAVKADFENGMDFAAACRNHGVNPKPARYRAIADGWYIVRTRYDPRRIRKQYMKGVSSTKIADDNGISRRTVDAMAKRLGWRRLTLQERAIVLEGKATCK